MQQRAAGVQCILIKNANRTTGRPIPLTYVCRSHCEHIQPQRPLCTNSIRQHPFPHEQWNIVDEAHYLLCVDYSDWSRSWRGGRFTLAPYLKMNISEIIGVLSICMQNAVDQSQTCIMRHIWEMTAVALHFMASNQGDNYDCLNCQQHQGKKYHSIDFLVVLFSVPTLSKMRRKEDDLPPPASLAQEPRDDRIARQRASQGLSNDYGRTCQHTINTLVHRV